MSTQRNSAEIEPAPAVVSDSDASMQEEKQDELRSQALTADMSTLPKGYYFSPRFVGTFTGLAFSLGATYFALQAGAGALVQINQDIGPSDNIYLFSIVWTIAQSISILLFGRNSDMFGRRNLALSANIFGIVGGIVACTAQSINQLIGANVILGLAAGIPGSYPLLTGELLTNKLKYLGTIIVVVPNVIATGFGPYLGLRLAMTSSWRWIFYIYIILMAIGTVLWYFFYFPPSFVQLHGTRISRRKELAYVDYIGTLLLVAGLVLFLLGVSWGGQPYSWSSARVLGPMIPGAAILIGFVLYEVFAKIRYPIVPMHLFRDVRGFSCVVIISAFTGCIQQAVFILWPSQVQYIFGSNSSGWEQIAWMSTVPNFGSWAGIILIGPLYHIIKHLKLQLLVGACWMTAFLGAMSSITYTNRASAVAFGFLGQFPMGWGEVFTMLMVQYIVSERELGVGFAIVCASRQVLGAVFASIFVAIYTNKLPGKLNELVVPAVEAAGISPSDIPELLQAATSASQDVLKAIPGMTPEILQLTNNKVADAYGQSFSYVYYTAIALGSICIVASLSLRDFDQYLTDHVSRQVYRKEETMMDPLAHKRVEADDAGEKGHNASDSRVENA